MSELSKSEIITWYNTSILPSCGTEELNEFMLDIARVFDALSIYPDGTKVDTVYKNLNKAQKAFDKYKFSESDFKKMNLPIPKEDVNSLRLKNFVKDNSEYEFLGFRHKMTPNSITVMR